MLIPAILVGILALGAVAQAICVRSDRRRFPAPGTMVDGLHLRQVGHQGPVVFFEAGIAASCLNWNAIQSELAGSATTYSYDRAGFGWSVAANGCSLRQITDHLHHLVTASGISGPFILVGHSFGGYVARYYLDRFPNSVAGLVLIDPATPEEWQSPTFAQRWRLRRAVFFTRAAAVLATFGVIRLGLWSLLRRGNGNPGPLFGLNKTMRRIAVEVSKLSRSAGADKASDARAPLDVVRLLRSRWSEPKFFWTMASYIQALPRCAREVARCRMPSGMPMVVISGAHQPPERLAEHAAMATEHIIARQSGHWVHLDEPELVVEAIRQVMNPGNSTQRSAFSP
ncbi:MAG: alpha/beta hydrolase [Acidobacteriia bacterium]|nr:alpha/beta hydrolase [Terriglobia bacterium]